MSWVDPTQKLVWKYNLDLAKEAVKIGFDEVNFDYVRFPSDGKTSDIVYANLDNSTGKAEVMAEFYRYIGDNLAYFPVITSADLFGMVLWRRTDLISASGWKMPPRTLILSARWFIPRIIRPGLKVLTIRPNIRMK